MLGRHYSYPASARCGRKCGRPAAFTATGADKILCGPQGAALFLIRNIRFSSYCLVFLIKEANEKAKAADGRLTRNFDFCKYGTSAKVSDKIYDWNFDRIGRKIGSFNSQVKAMIIQKIIRAKIAGKNEVVEIRNQTGFISTDQRPFSR